MNSYKRKRSRKSNAEIARSNRHKVKEHSSSEDTVTSKKEKRECNPAAGIDDISTTEDRNQLEYKLDQAEAKLDEANDKVKELRSKYEAAVKREKRLRTTISDNRSMRQERNLSPVTRKKSYFNCDSIERTERVEECVRIIKDSLAMDDCHVDFTKSRNKLIADICESLDVKTKLTLKEDLEFSIIFSIPDHSREAMKKFFRNRLAFDVFSKNSAVRLMRKSLCNTDAWKYEEFTNAMGSADGKKGRQVAFSYYDENLYSSISSNVQALAATSKLNLGVPYGNMVTLVVELDKGGPHTKIGYLISNVGSPSNFSLIGLSSLGEDHGKMKIAFSEIFKQLDEMNGKEIAVKSNGVDLQLKIRIKAGGDFKSLSMLFGHGGASSKFHCPICEGTKTVMKSWKVSHQNAIRSGYVVGEKSISKEPLLKSLTALDIVIPVNHVLTGITKKAMGLLNRLLRGEASDWNDEKEDRLNDLSRSIAVDASGIESVRCLKRQVMDMRNATEIIDTNRITSLDECSKTCIYKAIPDTGNTFDSIPCTTCTKSNHTVCARVRSSDLEVNDMKTFRCVDCRGESKKSLMLQDLQHIEELEEAETEMVEAMADDEEEIKILTRDRGRTSDKLTSALEELKFKCGVYSRCYYDDIVGEDARRLTRHDNAIKLWELIEDKEARSDGVEIFGNIHGIFSILHTGYQTPVEIAQFDQHVSAIQVLWTRLNPDETVPLKVHSLTHISENMKREGHGGGREIELIEHTHHCLNNLFPKYVSITPLHRRLAIIVNRFNCKRYLLH